MKRPTGKKANAIRHARDHGDLHRVKGGWTCDGLCSNLHSYLEPHAGLTINSLVRAGWLVDPSKPDVVGQELVDDLFARGAGVLVLSTSARTWLGANEL